LTDRSYLSRIKRPSRYLGREINSVTKDPGAVALRAALLFPDLYEVGMSHLGLGLLLDILNRQEDIWAERAYAPAPDLEAELRLRRQPLASLESGAPLRDFDFLGVSLQYELGFTNLLAMLDLGGAPLLAEARGPGDPVVIGGGPAAFNPEPVAPFFDALVLGDGEEAILELAQVIKDWKAAGGTRPELWQALESLDGVYVPALFSMEYDEAGRLREIIPSGRQETVRKRVLADLDQTFISPRPLVPYCQIIHDRLNVEIARGCTRGCRYCQAGIIYRPVRERQPEAVGVWVEAALAATGYEEASLLSLSPGDYLSLPWLLSRLMDKLAPQCVALSLPSLRADTLSPEMMAQIQRVRRTGLTIAPEAGSDRLRRVINKNLTEEEILSSSRRAFEAGWQLLKLYFMIGLPTETPEDREAIARLAGDILRSGGQGRRRLNVSLSTFIPKPHTPFQWEGQAGLEESRLRLHAVKDQLRGQGIQVKWNAVAQSWLEGIFSRGDRRLAPVLLAAYRRGCRLDAWSEHLRLEPWHQAFRDAGVNPETYLQPRDAEEKLPWAHLEAGVSREFLLEELDRAYRGASTPDCRVAGCQNCGVCDHERIELRLAAVPDQGRPEASPQEAPTRFSQASHPRPPAWYRLTFVKVDEAKWLSHLELVAVFYRSLRRSGLPLSFSSGFHPLPRVAFHGALPVGVESLTETLDLALADNPGESSVLSHLNRVLPPGLEILQAKRLPGKTKPPRLEAVLYRVASPKPAFTGEQAAHFLSQGEVWVRRRRPKQEKTVEMRGLVSSLAVLNSQEVEITLKVSAKDQLKATEIMAAAFGLGEEQCTELKVLKVRTFPGEAPERGAEAAPSPPSVTPTRVDADRGRRSA
jgi:radical SAM family uncharacterized protein/radical SAM-linked protein